MSETLNLHQVPEAMALHRSPWAGRIMSAFGGTARPCLSIIEVEFGI